MGIASIVLTANPVTAWEQFALTIDREHLLSPQVEHRDLGGYYSAKFGVHTDRVTRTFAQDFISNGLMREVNIFNDEGGRDWQGFINKIVMDTGTARIEADLSNMTNKAFVRYNDAGTVKRSTTITNTDSSDRFGVKERVLVGGEINLGVADQHAQQIINWQGWPSPTLREINLGGRVKDRPSLTIECLGYWHTLFWRTYNQTASTGDNDLSVVVKAVVDDVADFMRTFAINDNTTQVCQEFDSDRTAADVLRSLVGLGDGAFHRWVSGFEFDRVFYLRQGARPER